MESGEATNFAAGEDLVGIKVNPYHKAGGISRILNALKVDEIEVLRKSSFEKFIELAEKPTYSDRLGQFFISRQLKVKKKYESYVSSVITMLKRKKVTNKEIQIKYVCIAMLSFVILPTTHYPKISAVHAEGSLSFKMLITSIKERDKITLSQNTIAFPGFFQALQLVMMEAVPALNEVVHQDCSLEPETDFGEEGVGCEENPSSNDGISPGHAMNLDASANMADVLIHHSGSVYQSKLLVKTTNNSVFPDTKFVSQLSRNYPKLCKSSSSSSTSVPQNGVHIDSGATSVLLMQAHDFAGNKVCKCITPYALGYKTQHLVVMVYEGYMGKI
ncbi:hypothetical protein N665_0217s0025 [Sinapis alba]|nr:hypothetical protein N665_0217s0025 [Sinapis alba]